MKRVEFGEELGGFVDIVIWYILMMYCGGRIYESLEK